MKLRTELPTAENSSNMNGFGTTETTTTLDALKAAVCGETGASAKYAQYSEAAKEAGFSQLSRLFACTSAAEQIHIRLEYNLVKKEDPDWERPNPDAVDVPEVDLSLIDAAKGEIYETSDMYPAFIKKAQEENRKDAVRVFTLAKLAESVHAERYLDAYNNIDAADDDNYYLCPACGYIHKGTETPEKCPICGVPGEKFQQF